jgi:hypothetical protein
VAYTASGNIERIKLKAWTSTSGSLSDAQLLELLDDSLRSYLVPFLKQVRDEWFVSGTESVVLGSDAKFVIPNSIASTIRSMWWMNNNQPTPLVRIEPEKAYLYEGQNVSTIPYGYVIKGYYIQILPSNVGAVTIRVDFMERPSQMVLEEDAAVIASSAGPALTLETVPLAWQDTAPTTVDIISGDSPYIIIGTFDVVSLAGSTLTLDSTPSVPTGLTSSARAWVADSGSSPFPNIPIELHPLLQQDVITTLFIGLGDKRLDGSMKKQKMLEDNLRRTVAPRTLGQPRPIVNSSAPGMRGIGRGYGW